MNTLLIVGTLAFLLFDAGHTQIFEPTSEKFTERGQELSCALSLSPQVRIVDGYIDANLVITNITDHLVRICTLTQGWRTVGQTDYTEVLRPDRWKSDSPRPEEFPKYIVAIETGKSVSIPMKIRYYDEILRGRPLTIAVGYETGAAFAKQYGTWSGSIRSKPVIVNVIESQAAGMQSRRTNRSSASHLKRLKQLGIEAIED